jgi:GntR family transcriptional regulator
MSRIAATFGPPLAPSDDPTPLYLRLQERIKAAIDRGDLKPLDALPGERDIAEALAVSRVTVRKALADLVDKGLLRQRQGSGTFVGSPAPRVEQALSRLTSFSEDMRLRGLDPTAHWLDRSLSLATPEEAMRLSLSPSDRVCRFHRLRLASGVPMAIERAVVPERYLPDPDEVEVSLYAALEARDVRPVRALQRLRATLLSASDAELLGVERGSAALAIERVSFLENGAPVEFTQSWYRGDAYDFVAEMTLRRDP